MTVRAIAIPLCFCACIAGVVIGCGNQNRTAAADTPTADSAAPAVVQPDSVRTGSPGAASAATADSNRPGSAAPTTVAQRDSVAPLLETGCGGGVTGGGGGTFVTADGRFYRYQRNGPAPNAKRELTFVRKDSARAVALVQSAEREGITRIKYSEPSNMTCHLALERGGTSHEIAWPLGTTPAPIRKLVAVAKELEEAAAR